MITAPSIARFGIIFAVTFSIGAILFSVPSKILVAMYPIQATGHVYDLRCNEKGRYGYYYTLNGITYKKVLNGKNCSTMKPEDPITIYYSGIWNGASTDGDPRETVVVGIFGGILIAACLSSQVYRTRAKMKSKGWL